MGRPEEFRFTIDKDGRIQLDFRGMEEASYRRILQMLEEMVGPVEAAEAQAEEAPPPGVLERGLSTAEEQEELRKRGG